jgi:hypothetical protein
MKYLKRFNEELKSQTYKSAARKLNKIVKEKPVLAKAIGAEKRAKDLEEYAKNIEEKEELKKWQENVGIFSKYGEFNFELSRKGVNIPSKVYSFYLYLQTDIEMLRDEWDENDSDNRTISLGFAGGLIPKNIEDCKEIEMNYSSDFYNGFFWGFWIYVDYKVENSEVSYKGIRIYDYDDIPVQIADRKTAVSLKKLLVNCFEETYEYPSGYTDITNMYDKVNQSAIQDLEISATYGIDMGRIKEDIKNTQITSFYKQ